MIMLIVEEVSTKTYTPYLHDEVFTPIGVANSEVELGRTLPALRSTGSPSAPVTSSEGRQVRLRISSVTSSAWGMTPGAKG